MYNTTSGRFSADKSNISGEPKAYEYKELFKTEERELIRFMTECRKRTNDMENGEKCEKCKLRFGCYTEIQVEQKAKRQYTNGMVEIRYTTL